MTPREMMERAVALARQSRHEEDGRIHPYVGAVIARESDIIAEGFRGQRTPGHHAEQEALVGLSEAVVAGATVYSTLEPCVVRGHQMPCTQRLLDYQIGGVYIGILDPNRDIRGQGEWKFEERRVWVKKFEPDLVAQIREMNREFINYMLGVGILIRSPTRNQEISADVIQVEGTYRVRPTPGDRIRLFVRIGNNYYPQGPIDFDFSRDESRWIRNRVVLGACDSPKEYEIIVARHTEDFGIVLRQYEKIHRETRRWIGIEMATEPPGFERLASVPIIRLPSV